MILKVFTKRKPHGELIHTGLEWKDGLFEGKTIRSKPIKGGFEFSIPAMREEERLQLIKVTTAISGYEVFNDQGISIEKYVTPISEKELEEYYKQSGLIVREMFESLSNEKELNKNEIVRNDKAGIISKDLIISAINVAKECGLSLPYELVVSTHRAIAPEWIPYVLETFHEIKDVVRENLPLQQFLIRNDTKYIEHEQEMVEALRKESDEEILNKCS